MQTGLWLLGLLGDLLILGLGLGLAWIVYAYVVDSRQTQHTIRRNYPVIGRFRYLFEHMGVFFRQYFFAQDREEMPFNRADRTWVYKAAKRNSLNIAFGSTRDIDKPGTPIFLNAFLPVSADNHEEPALITFGPDCPNPYSTRSIFNISAMSFGALSAPAVEALSRGAAIAGCWLNTGEGGLSPYHLAGGCDLIYQIGTAKYGVRDAHGCLDEEKLKQMADKAQVKMFEIKLSQGAKPGKGGILPADKVTPEIATIRHIPVGEASISPNSHAEVRSVPDLLDMIGRVRAATGKPTGIKFVLGEHQWLTELCLLVGERGHDAAPDFITLDSGDGGSGAAPQPLMDNTGLPIKESLPYLIALLKKHGLRERIKVIVAGKLITPAAVAMAFCAGADAVNSARGFMFALGCIQALQCNKNTCPTGITTHNRRLQRGLVPADKAVRVAQYQAQMTESVAMIAHSCGVTEPRQLQPAHVRLVTSPGHSAPMIEYVMLQESLSK
ncbi:FMN-binding glutamate synthase family protein [Simiduia curdlanivorans]|uniref:FMN-binding glutamate synthase family protein n=1 Tax=Simiduia curdlanivorans TaxID=1492769 RepID=A0ABV8V5E5_9GAMM|nr:FMN-binding glutamate synthase family protein [Simiduia curdlanivorans]MDN3638197.1 FMN-binding glutamate synthase family protein [Simiduia curdlanivorans]